MRTLAIWTLLTSAALAQQTAFTEITAAVRRSYPGDRLQLLKVSAVCGSWHDRILAKEVRHGDLEAELGHYKRELAAKGIDICQLQMSRELTTALTQYGY